MSDTLLTNFNKIPITIITGYLGSGKTTLLNHIVSQFNNKRIAIIQNEFGEQIGLEQEILLNNNGSKQIEWLEMPNGCICCTVKNDFVSAIENLVINKKGTIDYVIVETDGLAKPGPIISTFWLDDELESCIYLDGVITVVDAKYIIKHLNDLVVIEQIAVSDHIILNKIDLVSSDNIDELIKIISNVNKLATIIPTQNSIVNANNILNIKAFDQNFTIDHININVDINCTDHNACDENKIMTYCISNFNGLDLLKCTKWIGELLWNDGEMEIIRVKGVIYIKDSLYKYSLQGIHQIFDIVQTDLFWEIDEKIKSKIVFIGKNLNLKDLCEGLLMCKC